jgi:hypothetical protein
MISFQGERERECVCVCPRDTVQYLRPFSRKERVRAESMMKELRRLIMAQEPHRTQKGPRQSCVSSRERVPERVCQRELESPRERERVQTELRGEVKEERQKAVRESHREPLVSKSRKRTKGTELQERA